MHTYNLEARYLVQYDLGELDDALVDELWNIFSELAIFWKTSVNVAPMKSNFLIFLSNRIEMDYHYLSDYRNAVGVLKELVAEKGQVGGYRVLFTAPQGTVFPPLTKLARARQMVVHEFIHLFLSLGGFKGFGGTTVNYPGFVGGGNLPGRVPYTTYPTQP